MLDKIDGILKKEVHLRDDIRPTGYTFVLRLMLMLIMASWVSFYPVYLLLIHMKVEKYFSYDIFSEGIFGIKSFIFMVAILICISALYLWGFIFIFRSYFKIKSKTMLFLGILCVLVSVLFHLLIFNFSLASGKVERLVWLSLLGLIFAGGIYSYLENPLKSFLTNWATPLLAIVLSATLPILTMKTTADIVNTGLENFKVGGGITVEIYKVDSGTLIKSGKLLLLTPNYVYLRESTTGYTSISRSNEVYVSIK